MLSLVADYDTTSSSSCEEDDTYNANTEKSKTKEHNSPTIAKPSQPLKLPSANVILTGGSSKQSGDVFSNPFLEAEKLEIYKLQRHVKMVESENHLLQKNGRKICWNNRKGRCRFGNKCKYAHDSDLVEAKEGSDKQIVNEEHKNPASTKSVYKVQINRTEFNEANDSIEKPKTRCKRPGLGDSIVPGKRAMKTYNDAKNSSL